MSKVQTPLDSSKIPEEFHYLIPFAEKWCEMEEGELIHMLNSASNEEIQSLRANVLPNMDQLYQWLATEVKKNGWLLQNAINAISNEYMAFSMLAMAADLSENVLKSREN